MTRRRQARESRVARPTYTFVCGPPLGCTWQDTVDVWTAADGIALFEGGWTNDHLYPWMGDPTGPNLEGWMALASLMTLTTRLRGGLMVSSVPYRHPGLLANMIATIDCMTQGRLEIGLGAGWLEVESEAYGIELGSPTQRLDRFAEAVEVIVGLLTQPSTTFDGEYYRLTDAYCEPKAVQLPHPPICIGGGGEQRTLPLVARWAQHWNLGFGRPDVFAHKKSVLGEICRRQGRDPSEIRTSTQVWYRPDDHRGFAAEVVDYLDAGADMLVIIVPAPYGGADIEKIASVLALLA